MNKVMEKTYLLIDELEKSDIIKNITIYKEKIINNQEIQELINKGNKETNDYIISDIRKKLYKDHGYKNYMDGYNKLMYIVMDINSRLNKITNNKNCYKI